MQNTSNPVNSQLSYLINLITNLESDCLDMPLKLLARKDSLTFAEYLDKFDLRGLWDSIRQRFTETKEALAEVPALNDRMAV